MTKPKKTVQNSGTVRWNLPDGRLHRDDDKPSLIFRNGKQWFQNGRLHRVNRPAAVYDNGTKHWFQDGKHHRIDGPAAIYHNGKKEWFLFGKYYETKEHYKAARDILVVLFPDIE